MVNFRQIKDVSFKASNDIIGTLRFRIIGGTTGDHFVKYDGDEWYCDCPGFQNHKHCRHVDNGKTILLHLYKALDEIGAPKKPKEEVHVL